MNDPAQRMIPGEVRAGDDPVALPAVAASLLVTNTGDRPIQVGSHFHFAEVNAALDFDRRSAWGRRLCIPAGTAVRFEPGIERLVELTELRGKRIVRGLRGAVRGLLDAGAGHG